MQTDPLISVAAAAKKIGLNRSTLSRQVADGSVRSHRGQVRLSEVLEDRAKNIDLDRSARREGKIDHSPADPLMQQKRDVDATASAPDATEDEPVLVDGQVLSYADARALKETYLARLRQLEFRKLNGEVASVEDIERFVESEYVIVKSKVTHATCQVGRPVGHAAERSCYGRVGSRRA